MHEILAERLTGDSVRHFVTDAMQWGMEKEAEAKAAYEAETGDFVAEAGFFDHPTIDLFGATPDGLLGRDGLIETKCPTSSTFVVWRLAGAIPDEHKPQMLAQLRHTVPDPGAVFSVAFSPDGRRLAWGGTDCAVKVWHLPAEPGGNVTHVSHALRGHRSWVRGVAFSRDGHYLASGSQDGTVKVWEAPRSPPPAEAAAGPGQ